MALTAVSPLTADPNSVDKPVDSDIRFTVDVVDRRATAPTARQLQVVLSTNNDLVFTEGEDEVEEDGKAVTQEVKVGKTPVTVTFDTHVTGPAAGLSAFKVSLREKDGEELVFCRIRTK